MTTDSAVSAGAAQSASVQTEPLGGGAASTPSDGGFSIPQEYAERGWASKIKSSDDLFKAYDNAQSLIGKRSVPAHDAPDADWDAFYGLLRPETPDGYDFGEIAGLPEGYDATDLKKTAAGIAHEIGLAPRQAAQLLNKYIAVETEAINRANADMDRQFKELSREHFGDKLGEAQSAMQSMIAAYVPEGLRSSVAALAESPAAMLAMAKIAHGAKMEIDRIKAEYGAEGRNTSGGQAASGDIDSVRSELAKLRTSPESSNPLSPEFKKNQERIKMLSEQVDRHYSRR